MEAVSAALHNFSGPVYWHDSDGYSDAVSLAAGTNPSLAKREPAVVVRPANDADVQRAVRAAKLGLELGVFSKDVPLCIRGGGHSELGIRDGALVLDMRDLAAVHVDPAAGFVTFGTGVTLGHLQAAAAEHGLAAPVGLHSTVGCGLVLQGGIGRLSRLHGLAVDNLVCVDLVTADGEIIHLDETSDKEYFWGVRGAGPNFGVVTRCTLRVHAVGPVRFNKHVVPASEGPARIEAMSILTSCEQVWRNFEHDQQVDLVFGHGTGEASVGLFACSIHGRSLPDAYVSCLGPPVYEDTFHHIQDAPYPSLSNANAKAKGTNQAAVGINSYVRHCFVDNLGNEGFQLLFEAMDKMPSTMSEILLQHGGGKVKEVPIDAIPFANRSWEFSVVIIALWPGDSSEARIANEAWANHVLESLQPFAKGLYAVNIDPFRTPQTVEKEVHQAFGGNLDRLQALKLKVDNTNLFRGTYPLFPRSQ